MFDDVKKGEKIKEKETYQKQNHKLWDIKEKETHQKQNYKEKEPYQKQNYKLLKDLKIKWMNWGELKEQYQK